MSGVAYLFPGQGAQAVGMGKAFYDSFSEAKEVYKTANTVLGYDLAALCFEGPPEELTRTERCQPALLVTSLAGYVAFRSRAHAHRPVGAAGLSVGELTALTAAEAVSLKDAVYLVQARSDAMAHCSAQHPGAMLAVIGLSKDAIDEICRQSGAVMANFNAPDQMVLSGTAASIDQAEPLAKARGAKRAIRLDVSGAFHSPLMQPAVEEFRKALSKVRFSTPAFPIISNVTAQPVRSAEEIPKLLARQITSSVLWEPSMRHLIQGGAATFLEFPPARVLTGLLRRINSSVKGIAVDEPADFDKLGVAVS